MVAQTPSTGSGVLITSSRLKTTYSVAIFLGLIILVASVMRNSERAWYSYLVSFFYVVSLALGGLFFTAIQHVTKAGWSVNVRRVAEALTSFLPYAVVGALVLFIGGPKLYEWFHPSEMAKDPLLLHKSGYLNPTFFAIRLLLFFGLWLWFSKVMVGRSLAQDKTGDESLTHKQVGTAIGFLFSFAFSYSFFSVDTLMSLEPHWFSTIFGVYCFAGLFQSTMAFMILTILYLKKKGKLVGYVNENHLHDLGKFMFAFTVFWAYIAFSQYMLIWYANMPEETFFYLPRLSPGWVCVSVALLLFKFIVPFLALLPRWAKRTPAHLAVISILILIMQYVDIYWLTYPKLNSEKAIFGLPEVGGILFFGGLFLYAVSRFFSVNSVVAERDPRIHESLHHHVI